VAVYKDWLVDLERLCVSPSSASESLKVPERWLQRAGRSPGALGGAAAGTGARSEEGPVTLGQGKQDTGFPCWHCQPVRRLWTDADGGSSCLAVSENTALHVLPLVSGCSLILPDEVRP